VRVDGSPGRWEVVLRSGEVVEVWADAYGEDAGAYVFDVAALGSVEEQAGWEVTARRPSDPGRVLVAVARIPVTAVAEIRLA
jgi:hypothetical protein